jgi:microcystin-dependent protein
MGRLTKPHVFVDGTPASADEVNANFDAVVDHINDEMVHADGSVAMTGALVLPGNAASDLQAVPLQQVNALIGAPAVPGFIGLWGGAGTPAGWLACDGSAVSRTTFAALFAAIGTTHGAGNGSTTFNVPDLRGRAPIGAGTGPGLTARTAGQKVGDELLQEHSHSQHVTANEVGGGAIRSDYNDDGTSLGSYPQGVNTGNAGGGNAQNMQPSTVVTFVIKT